MVIGIAHLHAILAIVFGVLILIYSTSAELPRGYLLDSDRFDWAWPALPAMPICAGGPRVKATANTGPRRYSSAASVPSFTSADGSSGRPGRVRTPHPGASLCPAAGRPVVVGIGG